MIDKTRLASLNLFSRKRCEVESQGLDVKLGDIAITAPIQRSWNSSYTPQKVLDIALSPDLGSPDPNGDFPTTPNNANEYDGVRIRGDREDERSDCRSLRSDTSAHVTAWKRIHARRLSPEIKLSATQRSPPHSPCHFQQIQSYVDGDVDGIIVVDPSDTPNHLYPDVPTVIEQSSPQMVSTTINHSNSPFNSFHFRYAAARERIGSPVHSLNSMLSPVTEGFAKTGPSTFRPYSGASPLADEVDVREQMSRLQSVQAEHYLTSSSDSSASSSPDMFHLDSAGRLAERPGTAQSFKSVSRRPSGLAMIPGPVEPVQRSFSANSMRSVHGYTQGQAKSPSATPFEHIERSSTSLSLRSGLGSVTMSSQAVRGTEQDIIDRPSSRAAAPTLEHRRSSGSSHQQRGRRAASIDPYDARRRLPSDDYPLTVQWDTQHGREASNHTATHDRQHELIETIYSQTYQPYQRPSGPPSPHHEVPKRSQSARPSIRSPAGADYTMVPTEHDHLQDYLAKMRTSDSQHHTTGNIPDYDKPRRINSPPPAQLYSGSGRDIYHELSNDYAQIAHDLVKAHHHEYPVAMDDDRMGRTGNRLRSASTSDSINTATHRGPTKTRSKSKPRPAVGFGLIGRGTDTESEHEDSRRRMKRPTDAAHKHGATQAVVELVPSPEELWG